MIKIISDTSTLYSIEEGKKINVDITPLSVTIGGKSYREFEDISSEQFLELIATGLIPTSSQPAIGEKMELYQKYSKDTIIDLTMADGLSGTYQSACAARDGMSHSNEIYVINTKTLCGPHRYLVDKAVQLVKKGYDVTDLMNNLYTSINHCKSFLIPADFDFLKRGGRTSKMTATIGGLLKIVPIMTQSEDGTILEKYDIKRTFQGAIEKIIQYFQSSEINERYKLFVSHAGNLKDADKAKEMLQKAFPKIEIEMLELSPAFITQGGPKCVAIQSILK